MVRCTLTAISVTLLAVYLFSTSQAANRDPGSFSHQPEFTKNLGQWPDSILFRSQAGGATVWLTNHSVLYQFSRRQDAIAEERLESEPVSTGHTPQDVPARRDSIQTILLSAEFVGANAAEVHEEGIVQHKYNYFFGDDPARWYTDVPSYRSVTLRNLYDGVDLQFLGGADGKLSYRYVLARGAQVGQVRLVYRGPAYASTDTSGNAIARTEWSEVSGLLAPPGAEPTVFAGLSETSSGRRVQSASAETPTPVSEGNVNLDFSTYLACERDDFGNAIAVDDSGNICIVGQTSAASFPTWNAVQAYKGGVDIFVTKFSADDHSVLYSTFIGGSGWDAGSGITIDRSGNTYLTGYTSSPDFPVVNPFQEHQGGNDAFVLRLTAAGDSISFSTFLGGTENDWGRSIALDDSGNALVAGETYSADFPTLNPVHAYRGTCDVFLAKLVSAGNNLLYGTFVGGSDGDYCGGLTIDGAGCAYVAGYTFSNDFPTQTPYQSDQGGGDAFVTKVSATGGSLVYSTYLGGDLADESRGIAVDDEGCAYLTGRTFSTDFPTRNSLHAHRGNSDVFVTKLAPDGRSLVYSTYLGSSNADKGTGIAVDANHNAFITGYTSASDFPVHHAFQTYQGPFHYLDAFVTGLNAGGDSLRYSTYLGGGDGDDCGYGITVDSRDHTYVTGYTYSSDFPIQDPCQTYVGLGTYSDAFVTELAGISCCTGVTGNVNLEGIVDLSDLSALISNLTGGGYVLPCPDEANVNTVGIVDLSDLSALISNLTGGGYVLPTCP